MSSTKPLIRSPLQLYKYLMQSCNKLPSQPQKHYKHFVKQQFKSHSDETDQARIAEIIKRSVEDAEWIVKKYTNNSVK